MENLTIVRYSTNDSSWMSPEIALVHAKENLETHLNGLEEALVNCHGSFEAEDFNVEIEYGEKVYTEGGRYGIRYALNHSRL
jgi:hypothetical protein